MFSVNGQFYLHNDCFDHYNVKIIEQIGEGNFSTVYDVNYKDNGGYALKIIELPIDFGNNFETEVFITNMMSDLNITVPFINAWKCKGSISGNEKGEFEDEIEVGMILMEKWEPISSKKLPGDIGYSLLDKIKLMHDLGYIHGDPSLRNLVVRKNVNGRIEDIRLIDFGLSFNYINPSITDLPERLIHLNATSKFKLKGNSTDEIIKAIFVYDTMGWIPLR